MEDEKEDHVVFGVGVQFWYDDHVVKLFSEKFPVGTYAGRHACGDPGDAATTDDEVLRHALQCSSESGDVTSAYKMPDGRYLCFTTVHEKQTTYIYVRT